MSQTRIASQLFSLILLLCFLTQVACSSTKQYNDITTFAIEQQPKETIETAQIMDLIPARENENILILPATVDVTIDSPRLYLGAFHYESGEYTAVKAIDLKLAADVYTMIARYELITKLKNINDHTISLFATIHMPPNAMVDQFKMTMGQREFKAIVREANEARELYEMAREANLTALYGELNSHNAVELGFLSAQESVGFQLDWVQPLRPYANTVERVDIVRQPDEGSERTISQSAFLSIPQIHMPSPQLPTSSLLRYPSEVVVSERLPRHGLDQSLMERSLYELTKDNEISLSADQGANDRVNVSVFQIKDNIDLIEPLIPVTAWQANSLSIMHSPNGQVLMVHNHNKPVDRNPANVLGQWLNGINMDGNQSTARHLFTGILEKQGQDPKLHPRIVTAQYKHTEIMSVPDSITRYRAHVRLIRESTVLSQNEKLDLALKAQILSKLTAYILIDAKRTSP